jgi:hypothetical protein
MCPYPQRAQYRGSGATTDAANFVCIGDESDSNGPIIADFGRRETILGYLFYCTSVWSSIRPISSTAGGTKDSLQQTN